MEEQGSFVKDFHFLGRILTFLGLFEYRKELSQPLNIHNTYIWSRSLFLKACFFSIVQYPILIYTYLPDLPISIMSVFIMDFGYAIFCLLIPYLLQKSFLNLLLEIEIYDKQNVICKYQYKPIHSTGYGRKIGFVFLFFLLLIIVTFTAVALTTITSPVRDFSLLQSQLLGAFFMINTRLTSCRFVALFIFFSYEIAVRYQNLHMNFLDLLKDANSGKLEELFDQHRLLYFQLSKAQSKFNKYFGLPTTAFFCHTYCSFLCYFVVIITHDVLVSLIMVCVSFIELYLVVSFAEYGEKESNAMKEVLCNISLTSLSSRCQKQIQLFILQIQLSDQGVFPENLFRVNKRTIVSMSTSAAAYCTVLLTLVPAFQKSIFNQTLTESLR